MKKKVNIEVEKIYLNVVDLAEYLRTTTKAIYNLVHRQELPYHKVGTRLLFQKGDVDRFIQANRVEVNLK